MPGSSNTIFSISSLTSILLGSGALLVCLLVIVRPEASLGLGPIERTVYWALHVGAGIAAMFAASQLVRHSLLSQLSILPSVIICGMTGTLLITPFYLLIDHLWPIINAEEIDSWLDQLHQTGLFGNIIAEYLEVLPWTMTAWLMINLPLLNQPMLNRLTGHDTDLDISLDNPVQPLPTGTTTKAPINTGNLTLVETKDHTSTRNAANPSPTSAPTENSTDQPQIETSVELQQQHSAALQPVISATQPKSDIEQPANATRFLQSLPGIFGKDIIAISSDLHYLNVFTRVGKTTVLGNLRDVANELQDAGFQVHRSHWVAHKHVDRIVNAGGQAACIMSNGIRVPVSRRRWKAVRNFYGQGVINRNSIDGE